MALDLTAIDARLQQLKQTHRKERKARGLRSKVARVCFERTIATAGVGRVQEAREQGRKWEVLTLTPSPPTQTHTIELDEIQETKPKWCYLNLTSFAIIVALWTLVTLVMRLICILLK